MAKKARTRKKAYKFSWETKRLLPFLPPKGHTLVISRKGITFDSRLVSWNTFFGFHGSMIHYKNTIVLKLKKVDHRRKVVGMSQCFFIEIPATEDIDEIITAITAASDQYCSKRDLKGYRFMK